MNNEYIWKVRCPESGYMVGECGCLYCFDEYELDSIEIDEWDDLDSLDEFDEYEV